MCVGKGEEGKEVGEKINYNIHMYFPLWSGNQIVCVVFIYMYECIITRANENESNFEIDRQS